MEENKLNVDIHIEQEFWGDFVQEALEHLEDIESNVISLEQSPDNMEIIHTMFRAFHTIKGLSGFVEHTVIQEIAHKTETMMDLCRKQELSVTTQIVNAILRSADYIKRLCEEMDSFTDSGFISTIESHLVLLEQLATKDQPQEIHESDVQHGHTSEMTSNESVQSDIENQHSFEEHGDASAYDSQWGSQPETFENNEVHVPSETSEEHIEIGDSFFDMSQNTNQYNVEYEQRNDVEFDNQENNEFDVSVDQNTEAGLDELTDSIGTSYDSEHRKVDFSKIFNHPQQIKTETVVEQQVAVSNKPAEEYMKVANSKIDHLVEMIGELIINQSLLEQHISSNYSNDNQLISDISSFLAITRELQSLSMSLRLVALKPTFNKITRIARDTIQELNKDVEFITNGEATEIDRAVAEKMLDPLVHLIKNAISHGVEEDVQDRINAGKSPRAKVELLAYSKRGKIYIEVKDDGRGIDTDIVYQKALEKGIIDSGRTYTQDEIKEFILLPGFSTAKKVDNISGRGVGMDVVKTQIMRIGGKVSIESELGKGSVFTLEVPVNHAIMNGTIIDVEGQHFIVATVNVKEIIQPKQQDWIFTQGKTTMIKVREDIIPIIPNSLLLRTNTPAEESRLVIVLELDQQLRALPITNVINRQEVVVKPVGLEFSNLQYISGMSILGNGQVSLILDIDYLFKKEVSE